MSLPITSTSVSALEDSPPSAPGTATSALALSGLLRVQRRWSLAALEAPVNLRDDAVQLPARPKPPSPLEPESWRLPMHLEDSEWSRAALGMASEILVELDTTTRAEAIELGPDYLTIHLSRPQAPTWPFSPGRAACEWTLPRDARTLASVPATPAMTTATRNAALVTLSEIDGRRILVDLLACGSTALVGSLSELGTKLADVAVELASRRWSDLGSLVLVAFDRPMPHVAGAKHVPHIDAGIQEVMARPVGGTGTSSVCVIVPPWATEPADPKLDELARLCEQTDNAGLLCCARPRETLCTWQLRVEPSDQPCFTLGNRRIVRLPGAAETFEEPHERHPGFQLEPAQPASKLRSIGAATAPSSPNAPLEIAVLGNVQVNGAAESFRYRRRLTELVAFLAMHPEGASTDAFATALWPEKRVPLQTLANRLSETRKALGLASDGHPRLRKQGRRHLIVEAVTDWDRFKDLSSKARDPDSWRSALALVRGRPFDGLDRGEWAQLQGFAAAIEAAVVEVACRLGENALEGDQPGLAHWAALQGLLVSPWDERLYRLSMRAADGLGNRGGVEAALRALASALELEGDPLLGIHPETSALYRRLTSPSRA